MKRRPGRLALVLTGALTACAAAPAMPEPPVTHPASPLAEEAPEAAPSQTLRMPPPAADDLRPARPRGH